MAVPIFEPDNPVFVWKPSLFIGDTLYMLPRPIDSFQLPFKWKSDSHDVPLKPGGITYGHTPDKLTVQIVGKSGMQEFEDEAYATGSPPYTPLPDVPPVAGGVYCNEQEMFDRLAGLFEVFKEITDLEPAELFIYHDTDSETYRKLKEVLVESFTWEIGDGNRNPFLYNLQLTVRDPTIYDTGPGE